MNRFILLFVSVLVNLGGRIESLTAQGTVNFANRVVGEFDAPVYWGGAIGGIKMEGPRYLAQLLAGPTVDQLAPIGDPLPFRTGAAAGYWTATLRVIPTVAPGAEAKVQIRAWRSVFGSTFEQADRVGACMASSQILSITTGGAGSPPSLPANLTGLVSFVEPGYCPEVNSTVLCGLGAVILIAFRWFR